LVIAMGNVGFALASAATSRNRIDGNVPGASWPARCRWGGMTSPVSRALKREEITRVRESL
jgi:hypothetical protein